MKISTRSEAKGLEETFYFTGKACKAGHVCKRYTRNGQCYECQLEKKKAWRERNADKIREDKRKWNEDNRARRNMHHAKRRYLKRLGSAPRYSKSIEAKYKEAQILTELTDEEYQVDHIIPLICKTLVDGVWSHTVTGLHVPWNMVSLEKKANISKGCRVTDEYLEKNGIATPENMFKTL